MENRKIAIIGVGNMGGAIVVGLLKSKFVKATDIIVSDRREGILDELKAQGVKVATDNLQAAKDADVIIVAVKPYHIELVLNEIKPALNPAKILISIVAGVGIEDLGKLSGAEIPIFRVMPNTAIALQESLTCISANKNTVPYRDYVVELFNKLGKTVEIPEELMAAATVLSSCGIAYALRYIVQPCRAELKLALVPKWHSLLLHKRLREQPRLMLANRTSSRAGKSIR